MKAQLPQPVHESYLKHRKDVTWKIIFPVVFSAVLCVGSIVLINIAAFRDGGDVARWGAVSAIWLALPTILGMSIILVVLVGIIYLLARLLNLAPHYTSLVQDFFHKIESYARRGADAAARPIISLNSLGASISRFFGRQ